MYDVNPVPYGDELSLCVDDTSPSISINLALETAVEYGLTLSAAKRESSEICRIVRNNWESLAADYGLNRGAIDYMRPAFRASLYYEKS